MRFQISDAIVQRLILGLIRFHSIKNRISFDLFLNCDVILFLLDHWSYSFHVNINCIYEFPYIIFSNNIPQIFSDTPKTAYPSIYPTNNLCYT